MSKERKGGRTWKLLMAGGFAGAVARTSSAPFDRIKLLLQVQAVKVAEGAPAEYRGVLQAGGRIWREQGIRAFWRGNGAQMFRIIPYSACQFASHEFYKKSIADAQNKDTLSIPERLLAGAMAGMTGSAIAYPVDTVRLRLAVEGKSGKSPYRGIMHCARSMIAKEGFRSFYAGIGPTMAGIAPYAACNFAFYDLLKSFAYADGRPNSQFINFFLAAGAGTGAQTICYPLDTVRRQFQMNRSTHTSFLQAFKNIFKQEGLVGFYRGWMANSLKVLPQNSIRFLTYEYFKSLLEVKKHKTDT